MQCVAIPYIDTQYLYIDHSKENTVFARQEITKKKGKNKHAPMLCINFLSTDAAKQVFILVGHAVPSLLRKPKTVR
jgi:hypothetical protein